MTRVNNTDLKDVWQTPPELLSLISETITLDPCAGKDTKIALDNRTENGLDIDYKGITFINPPFSDKSKWLAKAVEEYLKGNTHCIYFVTPDSTDVKSWWHTYIANSADYIWFSKGRINYISPEGFEPNPERKTETSNVTFGTALSIFGNPEKRTLENLKENGQLVKTVKEIE